MPARTIYLIKRVEAEITSQMTKRLEDFGITPSQFIILSFVGDDKADLSSAQLSRRFKMTPQSMNELVKNLEKKELLEKQKDPNHKRILRIFLTEKGKSMLKSCNIAMDILENDLFGSLNNDEISAYKMLMGKIIEQSRGFGF